MSDEQSKCTKLGISHLTELVYQGKETEWLTVKDAIMTSYQEEVRVLTGVTNVAIMLLVELAIATGKTEKEILRELALKYTN